jgi:hypothetical protein
MKHRKKFEPYVRLANGREHSHSLRGAIRLAFYQSLGRPFYVMVQRGFPNTVIEVGARCAEKAFSCGFRVKDF